MRRRWSKAEIREAIRRWRDTHGRAPRLREWNPPPEGYPNASTVQSVYGSWAAGMRAAGQPAQAAYRRLEHKRRLRWSRDELVEAVQRWAASNDGHPPVYEDWDPAMARRRGRNGRAEAFYDGEWPHASVAVRQFDGSWRDLLAAAGFDR